MTNLPSTRWRLARGLCRWMPPIISQRIRSWLYPVQTAFHENAPFVVPSCTGSMFRGSTGDYHGYSFGIHGYFDWRNVAIALAFCQAGDTIVEIGANIGTETVGFRDVVGPTGRVIAFEPFPPNVTALKNLVQLNGWSNVLIRPIAIGDQPGDVLFSPPPDVHRSGLGAIASGSNAKNSSCIHVPCSTLDRLASEIGRARIIFSDTEGAELLVLKGAQSFIGTHEPVLVLEASPKWLNRAGSSLQELHRFLVGLGYKCYSIDRLSLKGDIDLSTQSAGNWLCLPIKEVGLVKPCEKLIRKSALMPCIRSFNPLCGLR